MLPKKTFTEEKLDFALERISLLEMQVRNQDMAICGLTKMVYKRLPALLKEISDTHHYDVDWWRNGEESPY